MYEIIVEPAVSACSTPEPASIVATTVSRLLQTPPVVVLLRVVVEPRQAPLAPVIGPGVHCPKETKEQNTVAMKSSSFFMGKLRCVGN
jgi:hypothetical protein